MKAIIADTYTFYVQNSKNTKFPKEFRGHKIIWDMREALLSIWEGNLTEVAIPELGTPGYDFPDFIDKMYEMGQIEKKPKMKYYRLNIVQKS